MVRVMLRAMSHDAARDAAHHAAHDVLQPLLPNLSCPLLKNPLVHICNFSCGSVLRILPGAARARFARTVPFTILRPELRECTLCTTLDLRVASLVPWERTSYTHTKLQLCSWSSGRTSRRTFAPKKMPISSWSCGSVLRAPLLR